MSHDPPEVIGDEDMSRRARIRLWCLDHLPDTLITRPGEWFIAFLCAWAGAGIIVSGKADETAALLPPSLYRAWGVVLLVGGGALAVGLSSIVGTIEGRYVITRVPAYRLGLRLLGVASLVYGCAIVLSGAPWVAAVPLFVFAVMCYLRLLTLGGR